MKKMISTILALVLALGLCAFAQAEGGLTVTAPNGAPALAIATFAAENKDMYTPVAADTIAAAFADKEADFIIAPINAGAKLFKAGKSTYKLAAVVTWGNLFIASRKADLKAEDLNGADLVLFGENTINASVVLYALEKNGITPGKVTYLAGADKTKDLLLEDESVIVVTAEPALTAAKMTAQKNGTAVGAISVNELLKQATGDDGYTQAGLFVKAETAEAQPDTVKEWLGKAREACEKCAADVDAVAEAAVALEILPNAKVAAAAIPGCAIRFVPAKEAKELIEKTVAIDPAQFGGEAPADDFYYGE